MTQSYINLLNSYPVIDYSRANIEALSKMAITGVNLCQIGYEPELSSIIGKMAGKEKDIDILFYGSLNERRLKVLEELKAKGVNVVHLFGVYGKKRDLYISRAKVVLNIHFYESRIFEIVRVSYLLANKCFVISETGKDMDLEERFAGGVALTPYQDLVEKCLYYLAREDERQKIAAKGFEIFSRTKQSEYLGNALNLKYEPTDQEISQDGSEDGSGDGSRILSQETRKEINKGISEEVFTEISHESRQRSLYLDLMQKCLTNTIYQDRPQDIWSGQAYSKKKRARGLDWPSMAHTMIGSLRMANLREIVEKVLEDDIAGDFIETGTWRGGACIFMRAILKDYGVTDRKIWCADSFQGLPVPESNKYPEDAGDTHFTYDQLRVSLQEVQDNFRKYDLLDGQVEFLKGWFKDTLPIAPIKSLAVLRLDGDLYQSTMEGFQHLYHKLSKGGFVIIDDYGAVPACKKAVHDFRKEKSITDPINDIDGVGVWWRKIG